MRRAVLPVHQGVHGCAAGRRARPAPDRRDGRAAHLPAGGRHADGVYAACSFSPEALEFLVDQVRQGAEKAGRDWQSLEICASLTSAVSEDGDAAREAARIKAAFYIPSMPRNLIERHGVDYADVEPINAAFARGDIAEALRRTSRELADRFCVAGTPEEVAEQVCRDVLPSGVNHVVFALTDPGLPLAWAGAEVPGLPSLPDQIRLIAERTAPIVSRSDRGRTARTR